MPVGVKENIFRLEIAVDYVLLVQVIESESYLGGIEFCNWFGEALKPFVSDSILFGTNNCTYIGPP